MWDLIVSVPDHCLSFYFSLFWLMASLFIDLKYEKILKSADEEIKNAASCS